MSDPVMDDLMRANARVFELESEIASLRQRQEELEAHHDFAHHGAKHVGENLLDVELARDSLRTQLQQAEQRANGTCSKHNDRCHDRATTAESQLQQAETALRKVLDVDFALAARRIAADYFAALAAPPACSFCGADHPDGACNTKSAAPPTSSQEKP